MKLKASPRFRRDMRRVKDRALRRAVQRKIDELRSAASIHDVSSVRRLRSSGGNAYRIRIRDYRLGLKVEDDTAVLAEFDHRSDFYRRFP